MDGWLRSSTFNVTRVGPHVLDRNAPVPRNVLWYQFHSAGLVLNAVTWKPIQAPPFCMYCSNAARWPAGGASSKNMITLYWARLPALSRLQLFVDSQEKPFSAAVLGNHCRASLTKLMWAASQVPL